MVFSSIPFLFLFLPLVWGVYSLLRGVRVRNLFLLLASMLFYFWGEGGYLLVMLGSVAANYLFGLWIGHAGDAEPENAPPSRSARIAVTAAVVFNIALLGYFKYAGFAVANLNVVRHAFGLPSIVSDAVHLPLGISFLTFHAISYCVDCYRKVSREQRDPTNLGLYFLLFPHLIAGPIVRYNHICDQLTRRRTEIERTTRGIERLIFGLGKKVLLANTLGKVADQIFALPHDALGVGAAWLGALCYALQIYYDFSGYSDMAIGLANLFGFEFPENFNYPYVATSITDFWRRWHMSLSRFMRDYLYIPLGGNRLGKARTYLNLSIVFFVTGLWHGAAWNFVAWGMLQGAFMILERAAAPLGKRIAVARFAKHAYVALVLLVSWVFFRSPGIAQAAGYLKTMFGAAGANAWKYPAAGFVTPDALIAIGAGLALATPILRKLMELAAAPPEGDEEKPALSGRVVWQSLLATGYIGALGALFVISAMELAVSTYNPFIYFRF